MRVTPDAANIDMANTGRPPLSQRIRAALFGGLVSLQPRLSIALSLSNAFPQYTLGTIKLRLLRIAGIRVGPRSGFGGRIRVGGGRQPASRLVVGADCFVNDGCRFDVSSPITIGDNVFIGHDVAFLTATHQLGPAGRRAGAVRSSPITVGSGTWVGARSTILAGVNIGVGAVVAAGAVVTADVPAGVLTGGVPAAVLRELK